jgi:hypothetical protein
MSVAQETRLVGKLLSCAILYFYISFSLRVKMTCLALLYTQLCSGLINLTIVSLIHESAWLIVQCLSSKKKKYNADVPGYGSVIFLNEVGFWDTLVAEFLLMIA